jgi:hypothetical protein
MSLQFEFRVRNNTICGIVPETCRALFKVLKKEYFKVTQWCKVIIFNISLVMFPV